MPKISDLPEFNHYQYYTDRMYLVGNAQDKSTEEMCTGTVQLDNLLESYLSTQSYYDALIPTWVRSYYLGDDAFDPFFATYLTQPSALETYFTDHNIIPTYFSVWFNDESLMNDLFSDTQFSNYLESYVSGSIDGLFNNENFMSSINDYLYGYLGSSSTFDDNIDFRINLNHNTESYLSECLPSFMSEHIGDCLSYYLNEETNCYAIAGMFSVAMSYYMSVYGPLPT